MEELYHIHRKGIVDNIWKESSMIQIDDSFIGNFYERLLAEEKHLIERYGENYDIDFIIAMMEEIKFKNRIPDNLLESFDKLLERYHIIRREQALEEGRKLYAPGAPSRMHSIFLTTKDNIPYWINVVGLDSFDIFEVATDGNLFLSSDVFFPDDSLMFDNQVDMSKDYWQPKVKSLTPHQEFLFQGRIELLKKK